MLRSLAEERGPREKVTRHAGLVEDLLPVLRPAAAVIVNPPRTGLGEEVTSRLAVQPSSRLIYVSCDPATLGRDIARLGTSYKVRDLRSFDLFPQTAHVETVVRLERP